MLPTPDTSHVPYQRVYEPAEDSFLLLDTLSSPSETSFLTSRFSNQQPAPLILEVGPGSGVVIAFLTANAHTILGTSNLLTLAVDVNRYACTSTLQTVSRAITDSSQQQPESQSAGGTGTGTFLTPLQGDLTTPLRKNQVDVLVFNPPYVPTDELPSPPSPTTTVSSSSATTTTTTKSKGDTTFAQDSHLLELSYAGGKDGMETTNKLLDSLPTVLSDRGVAYILLCAQNKPDEVKERIRAWGKCPPPLSSSSSSSLPTGRTAETEKDGYYSWKAETVGFSGKQAGWEKLQIVRIWRDFSA